MSNIIFDEFEESKKILENGFSNEDKFFNFKEALLVGRRFRFVDGLGATKIEKELLKFIKFYDKFFNQVIYRKKLSDLARWSMRLELHKTEPVSILKSELETIRKLEDTKERKILFVILVLAKVMKQRAKKEDPRYFLDTKYKSQIKQFVGIRGNSEYDWNVHMLYEKQLLDVRVNNFRNGDTSASLELLFTNKNIESDIAFIIDDFDNLMDYLPDFCPKCNNPIFGEHKRTPYCKTCYGKVRREDVAENVRKFRAKKKLEIL